MINNTFLRTLMKYSMISWISFFISFVSIPIMTRIFPPEQMGGITIFQSALGLFMLIALGGQDQAFARYYHDKPNKGKIAFESYSISTIIWVLQFLVIYFFSEWLSQLFFGEINRYAMIMIGLVSLPLSYLRLSEQIYRMKSDTKYYGFQQISVNFITRLLVLLSAFLNKEYNTYITVYSVSTILLASYFILKQSRNNNILYNKDPIDSNFKELLYFGIPNMFAAIAYSLKDLIPRIILSSYTSLYSVGIYSSAISLASFISILQAGFSTYYGAYFYENYQKDNGRFEKIHHGLTAVLVLAAITLTVSNDILIKILGDAYSTAGKILPIVLWSPVALAISETTSYGINIVKKAKYHLYIALITAISTLILSLSLIPKYEEVGAAFAIGCSGLFFLSLRTFFGFRFLKTVNHFEKTIFALIIMIIYSTVTCLFTLSLPVRISIYILCITILLIIYRSFLYGLLGYVRKKR